MAPPKKRKLSDSLTDKRSSSSKVDQTDNTTKWLEALVSYAKETQNNVLALEEKGLGTNEIKAALNVLPELKVTELNLKSNCLTNGMVDLAPLLTKTKLKKLNVSECSLTKEDLLQLLVVLKDSDIVDLKVSGCIESLRFSVDEAQKCISYLRQSKLTALVLNFFSFFPPMEVAPAFQEFLNTSITSLDLSETKFHSNDLTFLFANLARSSVTDLNLKDAKISTEALAELSRRLVETKLEKLDLTKNNLKSDQLHILVEGLVNSKISDLNLSHNSFSSIASLFRKLNETQIKTLNLSYNQSLKNEEFAIADTNPLQYSALTSLDVGWCKLDDTAGENLMLILKVSNVTKLDISHNFLRLRTVRELLDVNLTYLNISGNPLWPDAFFLLAACLKRSKLIHLGVSDIKPYRAVSGMHLLCFLKLTEGSSVSQIEMNSYDSVWNFTESPAPEPKMLLNTKFTELHLCYSFIRNEVLNFVQYLKFSAITHLNLSYNGLGDHSATVLAQCLKETQIQRLNLSNNSITSQGAKDLAVSFKNTHLLYLHLNGNKIEDDGLEALAEHAKDTFLSVLDVANNSGKRVLLVEEVVWRNKLAVHKLVDTFERIAPSTDSDEFRFDQNYDVDVGAFLENCMWFYKSVITNLYAIDILLEEKSVTISGEQIFRLVSDKFPRQFCDFIACRIEANVTEHVRLLEQAEEMDLTAIVEPLLLNRPIYLLDKDQGILHPFVYTLLVKYKQPICSLAVEPRGVVKIIEYFTEHADIPGAQDVIGMLHNVQEKL